MIDPGGQTAKIPSIFKAFVNCSADYLGNDRALTILVVSQLIVILVFHKEPILPYLSLLIALCLLTGIAGKKRKNYLASLEKINSKSASLKTLHDGIRSAVHDISNPLTLVLGAAQIALTHEDPTKLHQFWPKIRSAGEKINHLNNSLRALNYISEDTGLKTQRSVLELADLASGFEDLSSFSGVSIILEDDAGPQTVEVDYRLFKQAVVGRLFFNALRFAKKGSNLLIRTELSGEQYILSMKSLNAVEDKTANPLCLELTTEEFDKNWPNLIQTELGLTLCRRLIRLWKGDLTLGQENQKDLGFFFVEIRLPFIKLLSKR